MLQLKQSVNQISIEIKREDLVELYVKNIMELGEDIIILN